MEKTKNKRLPKGYSIRPDGRYEARFTYNKARYSVYGKTIKECEEKKDNLKEELKNDLHHDNRNKTLKEYYFDVFEPSRIGTVKPQTINANLKRFNRVLKYTGLGDMKIKQIERQHILKAQKALKDNGITTKGVNTVIGLLYSVFNSAITDRIINYNPCENVHNLKRTEPKAADTIHRALTQEETERFLAAAKGTYYYNLFRFLINSGMRIGEAAALTYKDIDFRNRTIDINKTVARISDTEYTVCDTPKTDCSKRKIYLTDTLAEIIREQQQLFTMQGIMRIDNRIFSNTKNQLVTHTTVNTCIDTICKNCHIKRFTNHAFRDTYATRCIEQGMQPNTLKKILGHSSLKMTMDLYAHVMPSTIEEEMKKIKIG